jgi:hypothetical protein
MSRTPFIALVSFLFTFLFFIEYTPLYRKVHIPFDLEAFHYPLADYAFQAVRQGRVPQWDPTIYSGLSFVANPQTALFYPGTWIMFLGSGVRERLSYQTVQFFELAHVWLAFILCFLWLRLHVRHAVAAVLGGGAFAFGGYMMLQLQHLGLIVAYSWVPLALLAVDEWDWKPTWRPPWKLVVASAMAFFAGYPPTWVVFASFVLAYAVARRSGLWALLVAGVALAMSLALAAVQLLPGYEATSFKMPELRYGTGIRMPEFYLSYFIPNFFDFGFDVPVHTNPGREYLYLGAIVFAALPFALISRRLRIALPALFAGLCCLIVVTNPMDVVWNVISRSSLLPQVIRDWYFLAGLSIAIVPITAVGIDHALTRAGRSFPQWFPLAVAACSVAWSARLLMLWVPGGAELPSGWASAIDVGVSIVLAGLALYFAPSSKPGVRRVLIAALLLLVGAEYKAFGTSKRFNANKGPVSMPFAANPFPEMDPRVYARMRDDRTYRVMLDIGTVFPQELRHNGLTTPQGFDPYFTTQYKAFLEPVATFRSNWEFDIEPDRDEALRILGVRYFITAEPMPLFPKLVNNPKYRAIGPQDRYFKVFELIDSAPVFGWENHDGAAMANAVGWEPEHRSIRVRSERGGRFRLSEQLLPGWTAKVDGTTTPIENCHSAFQCVAVPPGEHTVEFHYRSQAFLWGAGVSLATLVGLLILARPMRPWKQRWKAGRSSSKTESVKQ